MSHLRARHILVNIFGTLFYITCAVQWLWSSLPYLPGMIRFVDTLRPAPVPVEPVEQMVGSYSQPSGAIVAFVIIVTILVLAATVYALIKLPTSLGKTGAKLTKSASNYIVPVISHHATLTPKKRQLLTARVITDIKITLCVLPVIIGAGSYWLTTSLPYSIFILVTASLAIIALVLLSIQLLLAKHWRISTDKTW